MGDVSRKITDTQDVIDLEEQIDPKTGEAVYSTPLPTGSLISDNAGGLRLVEDDESQHTVGVAAQGRMAGQSSPRTSTQEDPWADLNDFFATAESGTSTGQELIQRPGGALEVVNPGDRPGTGHVIGTAVKGRMA